MEILYNGIELPDEWPPRNMIVNTNEAMPVPYLKKTPNVIPIDIGRQLFVDDFLIEENNLSREFYKAQKYENNPVLFPETNLEINNEYNLTAAPLSGGVWWDPKDRCFKMWYHAGWLNTIAYAVSSDGIKWERPLLDIEEGTNRVLEQGINVDSSTVWIDHFCQEKEQRYKMSIREPNRKGFYDPTFPDDKKIKGSLLFVSSDGIHWEKKCTTGPTRDRSTMFYNPFRKKWVFSLKSNLKEKNLDRSRHYWEHSDFIEGGRWEKDDPVFWVAADKYDRPDPYVREAPQLYNVDAVAYESIMLGMFQIHKGPSNQECMKYGVPKITELILGFSRDGFHWDRPNRNSFIPAERSESSWDRGYIQSVGGVCLTGKDKLFFYYSGVKGDPARLEKNISLNGMYTHGSTGFASLRRDGFASLKANKEKGEMVTKNLKFQEGKYLFVNTACPHGQLKIEILTNNGEQITPFTIDTCHPISIDSTKQLVEWEEGSDLSRLAGKIIKIRFCLENGALYSFWISKTIEGASLGYLGAGSSDYSSFIDT